METVSDWFGGGGGAGGGAQAPSDYGTGASADYLMGTPVSDYGIGSGADYLMGTPAVSPSTIPSFGSGSSTPAQSAGGGGGGGGSMSSLLSAVTPFIGPALGVASSLYGSKAQNNMTKNLNQAQQASYGQYLTALNPPEETKQAMYNKAVNQVLPTASLNQRKIYNELASRGVRGQGLASPTAGMERDVTKAKQNAYLDIYGRYNTPQVAPPVAYTPGTSNLIGQNVGDVGTALLLKSLFG